MYCMYWVYIEIIRQICTLYKYLIYDVHLFASYRYCCNSSIIKRLSFENN